MKILDFIFPPYCVYCAKDQSPILNNKLQQGSFLSFYNQEPKMYDYLCMRCFLHVKRKQAKCPLCGISNENGINCLKCAKKSFIDRLIFYGNKEDPILKQAIYSFKYHGNLKLAPVLAEYIISVLSELLSYQNQYHGVFTFIPLHLKRQNARGFNQAEILANIVASYFNLPCLNLLKRSKFTLPQVLIEDKSERQKNVKNVFILNVTKKEIPQSRIFLVDDVCTTSATLQEAAKILKKGGAREIWAVTIAG